MTSTNNQANVGKVASITPPPETPEQAFKRLALLSAADYEQIRKKEAEKLGAGFRVSALDAGVEAARRAAGLGDEPIDVVQLIRKNGAVLFHDAEDKAFITIENKGHKETHQVESQAFKKLIGSLYYNESGDIISEQELKESINALSGMAIHQGKEETVHLRTAFQDGKYYIDICDEDWRVIEVSNTGWKILTDSPVRFRRTKTMTALPIPRQTGDYTKLWNYINISEPYRKFILTAIIDSYRPNTQYVVVEMIGGQGSGKSNGASKLRQLIDPSALNLRALPSSLEDLWISTYSSHCLNFENASNLSAKLQDALCIIATGGGMAKRTLYTDNEETILNACNPIFINGIVPLVTASDLSDRSVRIKLPKISPEDRVEITQIDKQFEKDLPSIFGGILDVFVGALDEIARVVLTEKPRMVSYAILGEAIERHLRLGWTFTKDYIQMRKNLLLEAAENNPAIDAIIRMMRTEQTLYSGTYKELLNKLNTKYSPSNKGAGWPKNPRGLSRAIARFTPGLEAAGIKVTPGVHSRKGNLIQLEFI